MVTTTWALLTATVSEGFGLAPTVVCAPAPTSAHPPPGARALPAPNCPKPPPNPLSSLVCSEWNKNFGSFNGNGAGQTGAAPPT